VHRQVHKPSGVAMANLCAKVVERRRITPPSIHRGHDTRFPAHARFNYRRRNASTNRAYQRQELQSRNPSGRTCDSAISRSALGALSRGGWWRIVSSHSSVGQKAMSAGGLKLVEELLGALSGFFDGSHHASSYHGSAT
jgi:hypothetical protein